jgi:hypothetical protein
MTDTNIFTQKYYIVHHRDDRPNEVYDNVDDAWAVSVAETEAGRPQPFIRTVSPASTTTS